MTYRTWLYDWVSVYKKPYIKTWQHIYDVIRLHIPDDIKKFKLEDLNAFVIQKALNNVKSSRMQLETFDVYHGSLTMAFKLGLIQRNVADLLIKPKHVRKIGKALTSDELFLFLDRIKGHRYEKYYRFCLLTGARRQEALDFTYNDLMFDNDLLLIRGTKTELSVRYVPIFSELYEVLGFNSKEDCKNYVKKHGNVRPFRFSGSRVSAEFKLLCHGHKLHDLRHTFATRCLECSISMKVVQGWLGHSRLDTTASIYSHVMPDFARKESEKFKLI